jgi:hypothetical protein
LLLYLGVQVLLLHPIDEKGSLELLPSNDAHFVAGLRRNKDLRIDPGHLDVGSVRNLHPQRSLGGAVRRR